ncbi:hypothetical protein EIP86_010313 [Pleurotus ostreatoroseus]|nr:hypothetical protein EIP86_010313 [Pleurotus ostreatoroseus]
MERVLASLTTLESLAAACVLACLAAAFGWARFRNSRPNPNTSKDSAPPQRPVPLLDKEQASASREPGEWTPVAFRYPRIEPCLERLEDVKPIPYRPFKWGEYFVTMGIRSMQWDEWIELDQEFFQYFKIREERIKTKRDRLVRTLPPTPGLVDGGHAAGKFKWS